MTPCWKLYFAKKQQAKVRKKILDTKFSKKHRVYKCNKCDMYHLTTESNDQKLFYREVYVEV